MVSTDLYGKVNGLFHDKTRWDLWKFCFSSLKTNMDYFKTKFILNHYSSLYDTFENGFKTLHFYGDESFNNRYAFESLRKFKEHVRADNLTALSYRNNDDSSSLLYLAHISNED
jgi:hypothetical protein